MEISTASFEDLKTILKNIRNPKLLDDHPWTRSRIVQQIITENPQLQTASRGQQLVSAIAQVFSDMQPPTPPRRGKRLDPRWGEFGLLAALYFTPFNHATPFPASLLDAWKRIDSSILYQLYGKGIEALAAEEIQKYKLVGDEVDYGAASTLSDWHKKGLQRLADLLANRERVLNNSLSKSHQVLEIYNTHTLSAKRGLTRYRRSILTAIMLTLGILLVLGGIKTRAIYLQGKVVYEDFARLQNQTQTSIELKDLDTLYPLLLALRNDLKDFEVEARPLLWLGPQFNWLPMYGGDIASASQLIELADHLMNAFDVAYQSVQPLEHELDSQTSSLRPAELTSILIQVQPQFLQARWELDQALQIRRNLDVNRLSPHVHDLMVGKLDPILERADEGLTLAMTLPAILGASAEGPKTYLLLAQNEDELRSTGGFITSVGTLVLHDGEVISLEFEQVDNQEDWSKPYPSAPWQMRQYMNSRVLLLRDANWFTDFPTTAQSAEYLYTYTHSHSVDGVIAFDQQFLVILLRQIGPLNVEGAPDPITADNVIPYMRSAKTLPAGQPVPAGWHRKEFISRITTAILKELIEGESHNWQGIVSSISQALEERHLLLQFDNAPLTTLLARRGWDNSIQPGDGDFLMVVDTNMGFNKTNALVETSLSYNVDLTNTSSPRAQLIITHKNNANPNVPCIQWNSGQITDERSYPMDRCYWNYLRIYKQVDSELLDAASHAVPGEWMLLGKDVPAQVDELEEEIPGVKGFGTLLVVPGGQSTDTRFTFGLSPTVLSWDLSSKQIAYRLKIQKQPGTKAIPINLKIILPIGSTPISEIPNSVSIDNYLFIKTDLRTDLDLKVVFSLP